MKPLKLKNPPSPGVASRHVGKCDRIAHVAVKVPVPHLEGEYSYLVPEDLEIGLGSLVRVPFGSQRTTGFVTEIEDLESAESAETTKLKPIDKAVGKDRWFDQGVLERARSISMLYGGSLYGILNLATPKRSGEKRRPITVFEGCIPVQQNHKRFIDQRFGVEWSRSPRTILILTPGMLWEQTVASLMLSDSMSTLVLVPSETGINRLLNAMKDTGLTEIAVMHSSRPESERAELHRLILEGKIEVLIGTRSAALAPFKPKQVIIVDEGDSNYRERRHPYFRADDLQMWRDTQRIVSVNHVPTLRMLATKSRFTLSKMRILKENNFTHKSADQMIASIAKEIRSHSGCSVLVSINDRSFVAALICERCRNALRCDCGFSLGLKQRSATPECSRCGKKWADPRCKHCQGDRFISLKAGAEKWALMLGKSIPGSRVVISNADSMKPQLQPPKNGTLIVLSTYGCEPMIIDDQNHMTGYQVIALIGGNGLFNSPSLVMQEEGRYRWARALGLLSPRGGKVFADLDPSHPVFRSLRTGDHSKHMEGSVHERQTLGLPPFSTIAEIKGEPSALLRLRESLASDSLFKGKDAAIFPIQGEKFLVKVTERKRFELLQLLQSVIKMRSSRRLSPISFILDPEYL